MAGNELKANGKYRGAAVDEGGAEGVGEAEEGGVVALGRVAEAQRRVAAPVH